VELPRDGAAPDRPDTAEQTHILAQVQRSLDAEVSVQNRAAKGEFMERVVEKLRLASLVSGNVAKNLEAKADDIIAKGQRIEAKAEKAVAPHHQLLDQQDKGLDQLDAALNLLSNGGPLAGI
jgi:hypothetical protein